MDNLSLIGVKVKVKHGTSEVLGRIYAYLPEEALLMLVCEGSSKARKFTIVRLAKDAQVVKLEDAPEVPLDLNIPPIDMRKLLSALQSDKPSVGEQIFSEISKTYTVQWKEDEILLLDLDTSVAPPYESIHDIRGTNQSAVSRVAGVLVRVRNKLGLGSN